MQTSRNWLLLAAKWSALAAGSIAAAFPIGSGIGALALSHRQHLDGGGLGGAVIVFVLNAIVGTMDLGYTYGKYWERESLYPWIIPTALLFFVLGGLMFGMIRLRWRRE